MSKGKIIDAKHLIYITWIDCKIRGEGYFSAYISPCTFYCQIQRNLTLPIGIKAFCTLSYYFEI